MYDIIYIGGGLNYAGAVTAAKNGLKVALVEESLSQLGGVCLHKGCIPSKMFLHFANTIRTSHESIFKGTVSLNMSALIKKKDNLILAATKAITSQCKDVDLIEGKGIVTAPHTIKIGKQELKGKYIVIGTGSFPYIPEGIAYNGNDIITSDEVLTMQTFPKEIAIYGSGAIGLEIASFFASNGIHVTLISRHKGYLKNAHPLIQSAMEQELKKLNITHLPNQAIEKAKSTSRGVHVTFEDGLSKYFEKLLVATGRSANIDCIDTNLIKTEQSIQTDEHFETSLCGHYAIGDCNGKLQLAHAARVQTLYVTHKILGKKPNMVNLDHVVKFIHTLPMSYATVGKNRAMLEQENISFKESIVPLSHFTASAFHNATNGSMIVYTDDQKFILGAEILAPNAEEHIAPVAMALAGEMDTPLAQKTIMAHPTFSEALERAYFHL